MKNLIRKILREQEEEDFSPVIPIFNYAKKYKDVYNYLDNLGLVKGKPMYYEGIIFAYPNAQNGILGWRNDGMLYINYGIINEISSKFNMNLSKSQSIIGRWVSDRFQLEVRDIDYLESWESKKLAIDSN